MRTVCTYVAQNAFAATISAMRLWLDENGNPDVRCETAKDEAGILTASNFDKTTPPTLSPASLATLHYHHLRSPPNLMSESTPCSHVEFSNKMDVILL